MCPGEGYLHLRGGVLGGSMGYCRRTAGVLQGYCRVLKVLPHSVRVSSLGVSHRVLDGYSVCTCAALQAMWKRSMGAQTLSAPRGTQGVPGVLGRCGFGGYSAVLKGGGTPRYSRGHLHRETHTRVFSGKRGGYLSRAHRLSTIRCAHAHIHTRFGPFNGFLFLVRARGIYRSGCAVRTAVRLHLRSSHRSVQA